MYWLESPGTSVLHSLTAVPLLCQLKVETISDKSETSSEGEGFRHRLWFLGRLLSLAHQHTGLCYREWSPWGQNSVSPQLLSAGGTKEVLGRLSLSLLGPQPETSVAVRFVSVFPNFPVYKYHLGPVKCGFSGSIPEL